jgi:hypothetical protein
MANIDNEAPATQVEHYLRKIQDLTKESVTQYDRNKAEQINRLAGKCIALLPRLSEGGTIVTGSET